MGCKPTANILISLKDEYVNRMLAGEKTVELRRRVVNVSVGSQVWIYAKSPNASVALCATVKEVVTGAPCNIWRDHSDDVGVSKAEFDAYLGDLDIACAIVLSNVRQLLPPPKLKELRRWTVQFHPPQFFKRLKDGDKTLALLRSRVQSLPSRKKYALV